MARPVSIFSRLAMRHSGRALAKRSRAMKLNKALTLITLVPLAVCAGAVWLPQKLTFPLDHESYVATISSEARLSGPSWEASSPLPLTFAAVEELARKELRKVVTDEPLWEVAALRRGHY